MLEHNIDNQYETNVTEKGKELSKVKFSKLHLLWNEFRVCMANHEPMKTNEEEKCSKENLKEPLEILNEISTIINQELNESVGLNEKNNDMSRNEPVGDSLNMNALKTKSRFRAMQAAMQYEKVKLMFHDEKEEHKNIKEAIVTIMKDIKDYATEPETIYLTMRMINHLASLMIKEGEFSKVICILEQAEDLDYEYCLNDTIMEAFSTPDLFFDEVKLVPKLETTMKFKRIMTNNLDMLAFAHLQLNHEAQHAYYMHHVLQNLLEMKDGDTLTWAAKASKLALFFARKGIFKEARHHLSAATKVLQEYELLFINSDTNKNEEWEKIQLNRAQLAKAWVRYGLELLNMSKTRLVAMHYGEASHVIDNVWVSSSGELYEMEMKDEKEVNTLKNEKFLDSPIKQHLKIQKGENKDLQKEGISLIKNVESTMNNDDYDIDFESNKSSDEETKENMIVNKIQESRSENDLEIDEHMSGYSSLGGDDEGTPCNHSVISSEEMDMTFSKLEISEIEDLVTCKFIENQPEAEDLYNFINTWMEQYRQYFDLNNYPTEFVNNVLDRSELYRYMAFFNEEIENQYKFQKQRGEFLESLSAVLREMRPDCYIAAKVEILRELAEVQLELMALNLQRLHQAHSLATKEQNFNDNVQGEKYISEIVELDEKMKESEKENETKPACKSNEKKILQLYDLVVIKGSEDGSAESTRPLISFEKTTKDNVTNESATQDNKLSKQEEETASNVTLIDNERRELNKNVNGEDKKSVVEGDKQAQMEIDRNEEKLISEEISLGKK